MATIKTIRDDAPVNAPVISREEAERKRRLADMLMAAGTGQIRDWSSGLRVGVNALLGGIEDKAAGKAAEAGGEERRRILSSTVANWNPDENSSVNVYGSSSAAPYNISPSTGGFGFLTTPQGGGTGTGSASIPQGERAAVIRQGLLNRGMPEHVADSFIVNFQDESGLDSGIVEGKPNVHGTRGFGLYQLTDPKPGQGRRTNYENFARARGANFADIDTQLDFLVSELEGPERAAAERIFSAPDTATAAQAIVTNFLRPAEEHRRSRSARYGRLQNTSSQGQPTANNGNVRVAQLGETMTDFDRGLPAGTPPVARNPQESITGIAPLNMPGSTQEQNDSIRAFHERNGTVPTEYNPNAPRPDTSGIVGMSPNAPIVPRTVPNGMPTGTGLPEGVLNGSGFTPPAPSGYINPNPTGPTAPAQFADASGTVLNDGTSVPSIGTSTPAINPNQQRFDLGNQMAGVYRQALENSNTPDRRAMIAQLLGSSWTGDVGESMGLDYLNSNGRGNMNIVRDPYGNVSIVNPQTGAVSSVYNSPEIAVQDNYEQTRDAQGNVWQRNTATGEVKVVQSAPTAARSYRALSPQEIQASNLDPTKAYQMNEETGQITSIGGGGVTVNNNTGATDPGQAEFETYRARKEAESYNTIVENGRNAARNVVRIDRLEGLLNEIPGGFGTNFQRILGEYGIPSEGLDTVQAAQALINQMVPEQRPAGSGAMSDMDLELFKQSVPRLINTREGNRIIIEGMRSVAQYDQALAAIAMRVDNREISRQEGNALMMEIPNPLAGINDSLGSIDNTGTTETPSTNTPSIGATGVIDGIPVIWNGQEWEER